MFENSIKRDHKLGTDNELNEGKGVAYEDYILHSMIGSIVQAGPFIRALYLPGHKCHGLKRLYQYFNHTDRMFCVRYLSIRVFRNLSTDFQLPRHQQ